MSVETEELNDTDKLGNIEMILGNSTAMASHLTPQASAPDMQDFPSQEQNQRQIDALRMPSSMFCNMLSSDMHPSSAVWLHLFSAMRLSLIHSAKRRLCFGLERQKPNYLSFRLHTCCMYNMYCSRLDRMGVFETWFLGIWLHGGKIYLGAVI